MLDTFHSWHWGHVVQTGGSQRWGWHQFGSHACNRVGLAGWWPTLTSQIAVVLRCWVDGWMFLKRCFPPVEKWVGQQQSSSLVVQLLPRMPCASGRLLPVVISKRLPMWDRWRWHGLEKNWPKIQSVVTQSCQTPEHGSALDVVGVIFKAGCCDLPQN